MKKEYAGPLPNLHGCEGSATPVEYRFQVNLGGIIDLLSHHLYSGPQVFLAEVLQNGVDAIFARLKADPGIQRRRVPGRGGERTGGRRRRCSSKTTVSG